MNFCKIVQDQEDANFAACRAEFALSHPDKKPEMSEDCDSGKFDCVNCPWKGK